MRQKNMVVNRTGLGTENDCADESQQQFTSPISELWVSSRDWWMAMSMETGIYTVTGHYQQWLVKTEQTEKT
jgi:hypothetical protein